MMLWPVIACSRPRPTEEEKNHNYCKAYNRKHLNKPEAINIIDYVDTTDERNQISILLYMYLCMLVMLI